MGSFERYTRVSRPSLFDIPEASLFLKPKKPSVFSTLFSYLTPILLPLRPIYRILVTILLTPILYFGFGAITLLIALPSHLMRRGVSFIAHLVDEDLANLVTALGTIPARDFADWQIAPSQCITVICKFKGRFENIEELRDIVLKSLVHRWNPGRDRLEYPELQQYVTKRLGYLFFKWDRKFDIQNHVKIFSHPDLLRDPLGTVVGEERLERIWEGINSRPFAGKRSAWELLWIPNVCGGRDDMALGEYWRQPENERRSVFIIRVAHGYSDGVSIYRFLLALTDQGLSMWEEEQSQRRLSSCLPLKMNLYGIFCGPIALAQQLSLGLDLHNILRAPKSKHTGHCHIIRRPLPVSKIKNARRAHNEVSFHSILIAGITGGIRAYFLRHGKGIPFFPVRMGVPVPNPSHSWKLRNDYLSSYVTLPIHKNTGRKRVYACEKRLNQLKKGALTPFLTQAVQLIGGFPVECARFVTQRSDFTVLYSEMKGPTVGLTVRKKYELEDLYYSFGLGIDDLGVAFASLSYNGMIHLILSVEMGVCRERDKAEELMNLIEKEIEALQYGDCTNL